MPFAKRLISRGELADVLALGVLRAGTFVDFLERSLASADFAARLASRLGFVGFSANSRTSSTRSNEMEFELLADFLGDFLEFVLVELGQEDRADAGALGGQALFLDPANGQNLAAKRDFARHRKVIADGMIRQQRGERGENGRAGGRAVLGNGAGRDVDMKVALLERLLGDA